MRKYVIKKINNGLSLQDISCGATNYCEQIILDFETTDICVRDGYIFAHQLDDEAGKLLFCGSLNNFYVTIE